MQEVLCEYGHDWELGSTYEVDGKHFVVYYCFDCGDEEHEQVSLNDRKQHEHDLANGDLDDIPF